MKVVTIVGARPQFIKAFAVSRAIDELNRRRGREVIKEVVVHTGQHYDYNMAEIFFEQLNMKKPTITWAWGRVRMDGRPATCCAAQRRYLGEKNQTWCWFTGIRTQPWPAPWLR